MERKTMPLTNELEKFRIRLSEISRDLYQQGHYIPALILDMDWDAQKLDTAANHNVQWTVRKRRY